MVPVLLLELLVSPVVQDSTVMMVMMVLTVMMAAQLQTDPMVPQVTTVTTDWSLRTVLMALAQTVAPLVLLLRMVQTVSPVAVVP